MVRLEHTAGQGTCRRTCGAIRARRDRGPVDGNLGDLRGCGGAHSGTRDLCGLQTGSCGEIKAHRGTGDLDGNLGNAVVPAFLVEQHGASAASLAQSITEHRSIFYRLRVPNSMLPRRVIKTSLKRVLVTRCRLPGDGPGPDQAGRAHLYNNFV